MYCCHCENHGNINSSYECPAKGETCRKCNRTDHIEVKLNSKKNKSTGHKSSKEKQNADMVEAFSEAADDSNQD